MDAASAKVALRQPKVEPTSSKPPKVSSKSEINFSMLNILNLHNLHYYNFSFFMQVDDATVEGETAEIVPKPILVEDLSHGPAKSLETLVLALGKS